MAVLRLLVVEDSDDDAFFIQRELRKAGYELTARVVDNADDMRAALLNQDWDLITSDHAMPRFSAPEALALRNAICPELPFLIVSGEMDINLAVSLMRQGALDFIQKHELARLAPAVARELAEVRVHQERRQAEEALRRQRDLVSRLVETSPVGILMIDGEGRMTFANQQAEKVLGIKREQIVERHFSSQEWSITDKNGNPMPDAELPFLRVKNTGQQQFDMRFYIQWPDGRQRLISVNGSPLMDDKGQVDGTVFTVEDITARVESDVRYRALFDVIADPLFLLDGKTGAILEVNQAATAVYGYSHDELLTMRSVDVSAEPDKTHKALISELPNVLLRYHRRKNGEVFPVELTASYFEMGGQRLSLVSAREITTRLQAEEHARENEARLRAIVNNAPFGAHSYHLETDGKLVFIGANVSADHILGIDHAQLVGKTIEEAFPQLKDTPIPAVYRQVAREGVTYRDDQVNYEEGKISGAFEIHAMQSAPMQMVVFFTDITERKKLEQLLKQQQNSNKA